MAAVGVIQVCCSLLQAPDSLKSVVQAIWLSTVSFKIVHFYRPDSLKSVFQAIWLLTVSIKFVVHCNRLLTH